MNKKVEELVDRVRLTDEELTEHFSWENKPNLRKWILPYCRVAAQAQLNKILKEDLALIDRSAALLEGGELSYYLHDGKAKILPVIPLAEEMKEVK